MSENKASDKSIEQPLNLLEKDLSKQKVEQTPFSKKGVTKTAAQNQEEKKDSSNIDSSGVKSFLIGKKLILSVAIVLVVGAFFGFYGYNQLNPTGEIVLSNIFPSNDSKSSSDALSVELFVMSQCPYGVQAENTVIPAIKAFGDKVELKLYFLAAETENGFSSSHGAAELNEDIRQNCIQEKFSQEKLFDYLDCVNKDYMSVETLWKTCAEQSGINPTEVESCVNSEEGKNLFRENIKQADELGINSSPTYYIDNELYTGSRSTYLFAENLCSRIYGEKECSELENLPPEPEVNMFLVNDFECTACNADNLVFQLKGWFPKLNVKEVAFDSEEGKAALEKFQVETVPLFYFDSTITEHYNWESFQLYTSEVEEEYALNFAGNKFFNKTEKPNHLDLFVMSQCPYGTIAEANLKEVAEALPDLTYNIYFIASETDSGFDSLHGQVEVNEGIRQTCIMKYYRDKLLDYQACVNEDIINVEGNWKACAIENDIEVSVIKSCYTSDEGKNLFSENIKEAGNFSGAVSGSPTYIINGQIVYNSRTQGFPVSAETMKQLVCSYNDLDGCEKTLSGADSTNNTPSGSC